MFWKNKNSSKNDKNGKNDKNDKNKKKDKSENNKNLKEEFNEDDDISGLDEFQIDDGEDTGDLDELQIEDGEVESDNRETLRDLEKIDGKEDGEGEEKVLLQISSVDEFVDFVNERPNGTLKFLIKETLEAFELRESHFRMAKVLGVVMMARECTPEELEKIELAKHLLESPDDFYIVPLLTENEVREAVMNFCKENLSIDGKKYAGKLEKFKKFVKDSQLDDDWEEYVKTLNYEKISNFCEKNNINFD